MVQAFVRRLYPHRRRLAVLALGAAAVALFWAMRGNAAAMAWWVASVSMPCKRFLSALVDPLPFSGCEAGVVLLVLLTLAALVRAIRRRRLAAWALRLAALLVWGYALVCALWGTQYYAPTFAAQAGMEAPAMTVEQLAAVTAYFGRQVNAAADQVPRDADGLFAAAPSAILADTAGLYEPLLADYPFLAGPERRAKPAFFSLVMSAAGFTGYLCPLLGESTVNVDCPAVFLPVTVAHEFAHQRGVAAEQEANFVGVRAAVASGRPLYVYSGWLFGYLHLSNALYSVDRGQADQLYSQLCAAARADLTANNAYWARWEGPAREAGEQVYTAFLRSYDQTLGMRSYGACVDLLVEHYLPFSG